MRWVVDSQMLQLVAQGDVTSTQADLLGRCGELEILTPLGYALV